MIAPQVVIEARHGQEAILATAEQLKPLIGGVKNAIICEPEIFDVFVQEELKYYKIEKVVRLKMLDYPGDTHVDILRLSRMKKEILILSNLLSHQKRTPF